MGPHRVIAHFDLDCFYAQVETQNRPHLKGRPVGITQKFLVVTTNYAARQLGVPKMVSIAEAKAVCPQMVLINGEDLTPYRAASKKILAVLSRFGTLERLGLDEAVVDLTGEVAARLASGNFQEGFRGHVLSKAADGVQDALHVPGGSASEEPAAVSLMVGSQVVAEARRAVEAETGFQLSCGVAHNKLLAKMASGVHKPNDQTTLMPLAAADFIAPRPVRKLPGVGHKTEAILKEHGISTLADLRMVELAKLNAWFGAKLGQRLYETCRGEDSMPVAEKGPPKSITVEDSFRNCSSLGRAKAILSRLAPDLVARLDADWEEHQREPRTLTLKWRARGNGYRFTAASAPMPAVVLQRSLGVGPRAEAAVAAAAALAARAFASQPDMEIVVLNIGATNFTAPKGGGSSHSPPPQQRSIQSFLNGAKRTKGGGGAASVSPQKSTLLVAFGKHAERVRREEREQKRLRRAGNEEEQGGGGAGTGTALVPEKEVNGGRPVGSELRSHGKEGTSHGRANGMDKGSSAAGATTEEGLVGLNEAASALDRAHARAQAALLQGHALWALQSRLAGAGAARDAFAGECTGWAEEDIECTLRDGEGQSSQDEEEDVDDIETALSTWDSQGWTLPGESAREAAQPCIEESMEDEIELTLDPDAQGSSRPPGLAFKAGSNVQQMLGRHARGVHRTPPRGCDIMAVAIASPGVPASGAGDACSKLHTMCEPGSGAIRPGVASSDAGPCSSARRREVGAQGTARAPGASMGSAHIPIVQGLGACAADLDPEPEDEIVEDLSVEDEIVCTDTQPSREQDGTCATTRNAQRTEGAKGASSVLPAEAVGSPQSRDDACTSGGARGGLSADNVRIDPCQRMKPEDPGPSAKAESSQGLVGARAKRALGLAGPGEKELSGRRAAERADECGGERAPGETCECGAVVEADAFAAHVLSHFDRASSEPGGDKSAVAPLAPSAAALGPLPPTSASRVASSRAHQRGRGAGKRDGGGKEVQRVPIDAFFVRR